MHIDASDLPRIMACPGSRTMAVNPAMVTVHSGTKIEGEAAHWAAEMLFHEPQMALMNMQAPNGHIITAEMADYVSEFIDICYASSEYIHNSMKSFHKYGEVSGSAENIRYHPEGILYLTDLRYGWRIIEPEKNWTMIFHAAVFCMEKSLTPHEIHLQIFQPRPYHPDGYLREWVISYQYLYQLFQEIVWNTTNDIRQLNTSRECDHCHALATCPAVRQASYNAIDVSTAAFSDDLPNDVVSFELDQLTRASKIIERRLAALEELAQFRIKKGEVIENYATEPTQGNTTWLPGLTPEMLTAIFGVPMAATPKPITPAAAIRANVPETAIKAFTFRPSGGTKLVRENTDKKARRMFETKKGS